MFLYGKPKLKNILHIFRYFKNGFVINIFIFKTRTRTHTHTQTVLLRRDINQILRDNTRVWYDWSYIVAWCGVGLSLLSAILFSSAAICLRGEREREEALNMQYLMPGNASYNFIPIIFSGLKSEILTNLTLTWTSLILRELLFFEESDSLPIPLCKILTVLLSYY